MNRHCIPLANPVKSYYNGAMKNSEFAEIEAVLCRHDAVKQAVCFTVPHERMGELPAAAAVFHEGKHVSESQLKQFLQLHLPRHPLPPVVVFVDQLPCNNAGEVERNGLNETLNPMLKPGYVPPGTPTESRLIPLWTEVLECETETPGRFDNFFMLGGDMVLAEQLAARISEEMHIHISLQHVVLYPCVGEMGCFIDEAEPQKRKSEFDHLMSEIDDFSEDDLLKFLDE